MAEEYLRCAFRESTFLDRSSRAAELFIELRQRAEKGLMLAGCARP
jgi:hypothetical protein